MECLVQAEPGIDVPRKIIGRSHDRFQRSANECIAMLLASG